MASPPATRRGPAAQRPPVSASKTSTRIHSAAGVGMGQTNPCCPSASSQGAMSFRGCPARITRQSRPSGSRRAAGLSEAGGANEPGNRVGQGDVFLADDSSHLPLRRSRVAESVRATVLLPADARAKAHGRRNMGRLYPTGTVVMMTVCQLPVFVACTVARPRNCCRRVTRGYAGAEMTRSPSSCGLKFHRCSPR